ncbi:MAG: EAL domain-containing protein [Spirochaetaceae bacterium]
MIQSISTPKEGETTASTERHQFILNKSHDFISLIGRDYRYEIVNDAYCWAMDRSKEEILGSTVPEVWGQERFENSIKEKLDRAFGGEEVHFAERFTFGPFERDMQVSMYPYGSDGKKEVTHVAVFSYDVSRVSQIEQKLANYEFRDVQTGLFNRRSLDVILDMEIEKAKASPQNKLRALLYIALQNLAGVTQTYGHHIRELLLENTGLRIKRAVRGSDNVFRFDGPDLALIVDGIRKNTDVGPIAQKICNEVSVPYRYGNIDVVLTCVIGVAVYPEDGQDRDALIQSAISARLEAERRGVRFLLYNEELHEVAYARMALTTELSRAFESEAFAIHFHPIVDLDGMVVGAEALLRWSRADGTKVPPGEFIPIAEETGLIAAIDKWVLYNVCREVASLGDKSNVYVTLNISASTFTSPELLDLVAAALKNAGNPSPERIKIEVTESECMDDPETAVEQMEKLKQIGIDVWIDDFGTGHSSLSYLRKLPAAMMKIDKEFIDELNDSPEDMVYLANIINSVRSRRKEIVVEGIESERQHDLLRRLGCSFMQGFYYSKPIPAKEFRQLLDSGQSLLGGGASG